MHIFIDTCALFTTPYWTANYYDKLLELIAKNENIKVYISEVVIAELRYNVEENLNGKFKLISDAIDKIRKVTLDFPNVTLPEVNEKMGEFDTFYSQKFDLPNVIQLPTDPDVLELVYRAALSYEQPFFTKTSTDSKKKEFKDAMIWNSYKKYWQTNTLTDVVFFTNNEKDFAVNGELPHGLQEGSFQLIKDIKVLYHHCLATLEKQAKPLPDWFNKLIADKMLLGLFNEFFWPEKFFMEYYKSKGPAYFSKGLYPGLFIVYHEPMITTGHATFTEFDPVDDYVIVTGEIFGNIVLTGTINGVLPTQSISSPLPWILTKLKCNFTFRMEDYWKPTNLEPTFTELDN